ncbi:MarR family transcriptional regulator [Cupriavidus oxalaticus]|uniref:MarR family transcriptional regulator n=1 Tax=Cupriavidus oxalaticus TaxID=96344 RepID=A0A5P3VSE7_9BURK|nr:MarR family transcriptional regulator [Cupriavidus oxalaticus]
MRRVLILAAMTLSALASELGGSGHRCIWSGMPRRERAEKTVRQASALTR